MPASSEWKITCLTVALVSVEWGGAMHETSGMGSVISFPNLSRFSRLMDHRRDQRSGLWSIIRGIRDKL